MNAAQFDEHGQPVGFALPGWTPPAVPPPRILEGRYCRVEPLDAARHAAGFHASDCLETDRRGWTYMTYGPFATADTCRDWAEQTAGRKDYLCHAILDRASGQVGGLAAYMRIDTANGCIEIGGIKLTPVIARRPAATEAMHLLMRNAFDLGYRRYEWKCDALNKPSRAAATRLGFSYEGTFLQAVVMKGRNRDTAWFSVTDREWPSIRTAHELWLAPQNFDDKSIQRESLSSLTAPLQRRKL